MYILLYNIVYTVPQQTEEAWTCNYQIYIIRSRLMKAYYYEDVFNGKIENHHADSDDLSKTLSGLFSYNAKIEALAIRDDICFLTKCLKEIKDHRNDRSHSFTFHRDVIDPISIDILKRDDDETEGVAPFARKKVGSKKSKTRPKSRKKNCNSKSELRRMAKEIKSKEDAEYEQGCDFWDSKMKLERDKVAEIEETKLQISGSKRRRVGERATCEKSYKCRAFRRGLSGLSESTRTFQNMLPYMSEIANRTNPLTSAISLVNDPIGRYPDRSGVHWEPKRVKPARFVLAPSQEYFDKFVDDLIKHRDDYKVITHPAEIDFEVMGCRNHTYKEFKTNCKKEEVAELMDENKDALSDPNLLQQSPAPTDQTGQAEAKDCGGLLS